MIIKIIPNDTLFFRDGKPFEMGDETWANGIFPPPPSVIYGAIRSAYIANNGGLERFFTGNMSYKIGTKDSAGSFKVRNVYLSHSHEESDITDNFYFPAPLDIAKDKENPQRYYRRTPADDDKKVCSLPVRPLLPDSGEAKVEPLENAYIHQSVFFSNYARDLFFNIQTKDIDEIIRIEPKVGIKRDNITKTADEGHLYRVGMNRFEKGWAIYTEIEGLEKNDLIKDSEWGLIKLGGEGKTAKFKIVPDRSEDFFVDEKNLIKSIREYKKFKLYFLTPAISNHGWLPDFINIDNYSINNFPKIKLISASVGKPVYLGGWDMAKNKPKEMVKAIPAGSVYYFAISEDDIDDNYIERLKRCFHKQSKSKKPEEGFGFCLLTNWEDLKDESR